jgi:hypothetical protein
MFWDLILADREILITSDISFGRAEQRPGLVQSWPSVSRALCARLSKFPHRTGWSCSLLNTSREPSSFQCPVSSGRLKYTQRSWRSTMSKAIPKFGSFRPKTTALPPAEEKEKKHSSREKDEAREEERRKHHHRRHRSRSRERLDHVAEPSHAQEKSPKSPETFFVDRKGDEKNLVYGSIHRYDVSAFYRVGAGSVLVSAFYCLLRHVLGVFGTLRMSHGSWVILPKLPHGQANAPFFAGRTIQLKN